MESDNNTTVVVEETPTAVVEEAVVQDPTPVVPEKCSSTSPDGLYACDLDAHGSDVVHSHAISNINGLQITYWN